MISIHVYPQSKIWVAFHAADRATVYVSGEIDIATAPQLAAALDEAVGGDRDVTVDLSDTTFFGVSGVNVLVAAHIDADRRGRTLRVTHADDVTSRLLELNGLRTLLVTPPAGGDGLNNERTGRARRSVSH
jgi:anti-sigma B factor antagonist